MNKEIKYLTDGQVTKLMNTVVGIRDKLIIRLLLDTGMRVGEFTKLKADHLDTENCYIRIPKENSKTKQARTVRVNRQLMNDLLAYCRFNQIRHSYIWKGAKTYYPLTTRSVQIMVKRYGIKSGIDWLTPHKLRHTHVVSALQAGVPINAVQAQVGHMRLTTTQVYAKLAPKEVSDAYERAGL